MKKVKRINDYLLIVLVILFTGVSVLLYDQYKQKIERENRIVELTATYNRLAEDSKAGLDSAIIIHTINIKNLSNERDSIETLYKLERRRSKTLQDKLDAITLKPIEVSPDSSYAYINEVYPAKEEKNYNIDGFQVRTFHQIDLINKANQLLTESLYKNLEYCDNMSFNLSQQLDEYKGLYSTMSKKYDIALANNKSLLIELGDMSSDFQKQLRRNRLTIGGILAGIVTGTVAIIVLN